MYRMRQAFIARTQLKAEAFRTSIAAMCTLSIIWKVSAHASAQHHAPAVSRWSWSSSRCVRPWGWRRAPASAAPLRRRASCRAQTWRGLRSAGAAARSSPRAACTARAERLAAARSSAAASPSSPRAAAKRQRQGSLSTDAETTFWTQQAMLKQKTLMQNDGTRS
eukprot:6213575-Pleurochrysis_carterae.AAC.1